MKLLDAASTGTGTAQALHFDLNRHHSNLYTLYVYGSFDGNAATVQISPNGTDWFDVDGADNITAAIALNMEIRCKFIRATITGAGNSTITVEIL